MQQILDEGVELHLNTRIDDIPGLFDKGYHSVVIATGAHIATKLSIPGAEHPDNWLSLDLLKKACLETGLDLSGREIVVLGAGDVALDAARSAVRCGQPKVSIVCRGMRASFNELHEAVAEGVKILNNRVFKEIDVRYGKIMGVLCLDAEVGDVVRGQRQVKEIPGSEHIIPCDMVIWALGQRPDFTFLPEDGTHRHPLPGRVVGQRRDDDHPTRRVHRRRPAPRHHLLRGGCHRRGTPCGPLRGSLPARRERRQGTLPGAAGFAEQGRD